MSVWACLPDALASAEARVLAGVAEAPPMPVGGSRVYVRGVLAREPSPFSRLLGASTYQGLAEQIAQAATTGRVVLDLDSPGGDVAGLHDLAALVAGLGVPTVAEVRGTCCSAAYWLASACDSILVTPDACLGSVGVLYHQPPAAPDVVVASASPRKGARDGQWQELVDDYAALMMGDIALWRGLGGPAEVSAAYGGGAQVSGVRAVALGLADGFLTAIEEEGTMPRVNPAPLAAARAEAPIEAESPQGPTLEELTAENAALKAELDELKAKMAEMMPEEMPAEAAALASAHGGAAPALSALAARVVELERAGALARKSELIGVAVAEGRIAPHERAVAEALYDSHPELYRAQFAGRAAGSAVPLGRVTHGAAVAPDDLHTRAVAHCAANRLDARNPSHYRQAIAAVAARKE